ncbi:hypothetical protein T12_10803 [Trichinella patagoniensis]|uniref:Uncharacterized protein n=1 Tax=Trichinella patagoniensis TaxID=990121 RepID=A0A0V0Z533_9BILA|nr:hypothetical protein T12_10803 [Trichinella patagoniensis]
MANEISCHGLELHMKKDGSQPKGDANLVVSHFFTYFVFSPNSQRYNIFYMKHAVSNHAALNQVLTHKFFGISQEIRNHGRSGLIVFWRVPP